MKSMVKVNKFKGENSKAWGETLRFSVLLLLLLIFCFKAHGESFEERRALVGLKLFRTLVTADLDLAKKVEKNGEVPVLLIYATQKDKAEAYRRHLQTIFQSVKKFEFKVMVADIDDLDKAKPVNYSAIFIAQQLKDEELKPIVDHGINKSVIVFSPFEGDVERGVLGGLSVQATVRPIINMQTLKRSKLSIKPFFIKVAKHYE